MSLPRCPHCGRPNRAGSNFCNNCGADLRPDASQSQADSSARPSPPSSEEDPPTSDEQILQAPTDSDLTADAEDRPSRTQAALHSELAAEQPWLDVDDFASQEEPERGETDVEDQSRSDQDRLVTGIQGLLPPVTVLSRGQDEAEPVTPGWRPEVPGNTEARQLRRIFAEEPRLLPAELDLGLRQLPSLRIRWVFLLIGLAVAAPILFGFSRPGGEPTLWPGVEEAYAAIDNLSPNADVLVFWAFDPATAGEVDLAAIPVLRHLIDQRAHLLVVSPLPNGPATARRAFRRALADMQESGAPSPASANALWTMGGYLPGGATVLPLLGQDPDVLFTQDGRAGSPDLAIVLAAQAEDVQMWLEQVQPLNGLPVVAVTSAGVDPAVRPYFDSGQLRGLVSGFDGAANYARQVGAPTNSGLDMMSNQILAQNWAQIALLVVIVLGNLTALTARSNRS